MSDVDPRMLGIHPGTVYDNADPKGLGRARVKVPGLCDSPATGWAWPFGWPGAGGTDRGSFRPPPRGASVVVFFNQGDPDAAWYACGHFGSPGGTSQVPEPAKSAGPNAHQVQVVLESDRWRISADDRDASPYLAIEDKAMGNKIEIDGKTGGVLIDAKVALQLKAIGVVSIEGLQVIINGRTVRPGSDPI